MKYKNISQRAKRYAAGKNPRANVTSLPLHVDSVRAQSFADGYRLAMKEIRGLFHTLNAEDEKRIIPLTSEMAAKRVWDLANDSERLK